METNSIEFRRLGPGDLEAVCRLFAAIRADPDRNRFRPHGFDDDDARRVTGYAGSDLYAGAFDGIRMIGYGMLRGWDEGFPIPSLGLYVHGEFRGRGTGRWLLDRLHASAGERGATAVRLTVDRENLRAIRLYGSIGYSFRPLDAVRLVGIRVLTQSSP